MKDFKQVLSDLNDYNFVDSRREQDAESMPPPAFLHRPLSQFKEFPVIEISPVSNNYS
jgi:hypothetical protein